MQIIHSLPEWQQLRSTLATDLKIGLVTTMGGLHQGHQTLLQQSVADNDISVLSIFVNPTQFSESDDFDHYPKTHTQDIQLADTLGVDYALIPSAADIYADQHHFMIHCTQPWSQILEGQHRPHHFNGMLTVVLKLLLLVRPHKAYFGEKDYQQYQLVHEMVNSFFLNIDIVPCATIREPSMLPYSSRNKGLSIDQRKIADAYAHIIHQYPTKNTSELTHELEQLRLEVDYVETYHKRLFTAVHIGDTRLIDNFSTEAALC